MVHRSYKYIRFHLQATLMEIQARQTCGGCERSHHKGLGFDEVHRVSMHDHLHTVALYVARPTPP
jgi:hypothetical protein